MSGNLIVVSQRKNDPKIPNGYTIIDISRKGILGNQYSVEKYGRDKCIEMFDQNWDKFLENNQETKDQLNMIYKKIKQGEDVALSCWCSPKTCHGDVIQKKILEQIKKRVG